MRSNRISHGSRTAFAAALLLLSAWAMGCGGSPAPPEEEPSSPAREGADHDKDELVVAPAMLERMGVRTAVATVRTLPVLLETTGRVDFDQNRLAHVSPRIPGRVESVRANLGDRVRRGQALAVLDSIELGRAKAAYLEARAREDLTRQNFERERDLHAERISSEKEMLAARAAHLEAVARLQNAEETLHLYGLAEEQIAAISFDSTRISLLSVVAPIRGKIVGKHVTVGELVTPERNLFTVADLSRVWIWIDVYERDVGHVHLDDDVRVEVDAWANTPLAGKISYVSDQVDTDTRTVRARIDVDNTEGRLRPGMFARVQLSDPHRSPEGRASSVVVPEGAVQRSGDLFLVFIAEGDGRFQRREVQLGRRAAGLVEILSGVAEGESVAVSGTFLLKSEASKEEMGEGHEH